MATSDRKKEPVVYALSRPSRCYGCDKRMLVGEIVRRCDNDEDKEVYCLKCQKLDHLSVLPTGNAKVTRLAKKYSQSRFLIMKWSDTWKCYERQGLLVEADALARARKEAIES